MPPSSAPIVTRNSTSSGEKVRDSIAWTLITPMIESFQGMGTDSMETNCDWSKPGTHLNRGSTRTSGEATGRPISAARPVRPSPTAIWTDPTWSRSRPFVAARRILSLSRSIR